jgi:hypothetical protein
METVIQCPQCEKKLRVPDSLIGKKAKCPGCGSVIPITAPEAPAPTPAAGAGECFRVGSRALAPWMDQYLYPATIVAIMGDQCQVNYDDGDQKVVPQSGLAPIAVQVGERIFIRPQAEHRLMYFPAIVRRVKGETVDVEFEANELQAARVETQLSLSRARFLRGPGRAGQAAPPPPPGSTLYAVGDRVLARWMDLYWYPATVIAVEAGGYSVLYDDGGQRVVSDAQVMPITVEEGERIFMRPRSEARLIYFPAIVSRVDGETLDVDFEAHEHIEAHAEANLKVGRARFWRCPRRVPRQSWSEGDRVFGLLDDAYWYPAEIVSIDDDRIGLQLLFGGEALVTPELLTRLTVKAGTRVECRWKGEEHYYPGTISRINGDRVQIDYDDGATEATVIRLIRVPKQEA